MKRHIDNVMSPGCYADGIDCEGRTVLSVAAAEGSAGVVQVKIFSGCNKNICTLHYVQVLLDRGLDENHRDNAGWGPLHYASFEGHSVIVKLLGGSLSLELSTISQCPEKAPITYKNHCESPIESSSL